jgi:hypothetical protein
MLLGTKVVHVTLYNDLMYIEMVKPLHCCQKLNFQRIIEYKESRDLKADRYMKFFAYNRNIFRFIYIVM